MRVVEIGEIGSTFGEGLFDEVCEAVFRKGDWHSIDVAETVHDAIGELCKNKLPERGVTLEATKEELMELGFDILFGQEVKIVKKETEKS